MMNTSWRFVVATLALALGWCCVLPFAWADESSDRPSDLEAVRNSGKLRMLCWPHQQSEFVRRMVAEYGEDGLHRFTGLDVELMHGFAESLGVELEVTPGSSFADLLPALLDGRGDLVASSLTITPARDEIVDFSRPYFIEKAVVVTRKDSDVETLDDLRGKIAASVAGSSHEERLRGHLGDELRLSATEYTLESITQVLEGDADYTLLDATAIESARAKYPEIHQNVEVAFVFPSQEAYGIAVRPGSDLLPLLNDYLAELESSGELRRMKTSYGLSE